MSDRLIATGPVDVTFAYSVDRNTAPPTAPDSKLLTIRVNITIVQEELNVVITHDLEDDRELIREYEGRLKLTFQIPYALFAVDIVDNGAGFVDEEDQGLTKIHFFDSWIKGKLRRIYTGNVAIGGYNYFCNSANTNYVVPDSDTVINVYDDDKKRYWDLVLYTAKYTDALTAYPAS